jgi:hypothetical protein
MNQRCGSSNKGAAFQAQSPEFKLSPTKKKNPTGKV